MDHELLKWVIEITIYIFSLVVSAYAVKSIPFNKFLNHARVKEAWILYMLTTIVITFCLGSLIIKFIGIEIWLS